MIHLVGFFKAHCGGKTLLFACLVGGSKHFYVKKGITLKGANNFAPKRGVFIHGAYVHTVQW